MGRRRGRIVGQQRVVPVSLTTIIKSKAFRLGFETAKRGEPWGAEYEKMDVREQWLFERGRMFGIVAPHVKPMTGIQVEPAAIHALSDAFKSRAVI